MLTHPSGPTSAGSLEDRLKKALNLQCRFFHPLKLICFTLGKRMPIIIKIRFNKESNSLNFAKNQADKQISSRLNKGIGIISELMT